MSNGRMLRQQPQQKTVNNIHEVGLGLGLGFTLTLNPTLNPNNIHEPYMHHTGHAAGQWLKEEGLCNFSWVT